MTTTNPLLDFADLPRFDLIQPEHVKPAIESLLADGRALIERLTADSTPATWADFGGALSDGLEPFGRAWGIVGHLHSVNDVPAWRDAYNEMLPEVSRFYAELGQNLKLFDKYKALRAGAGIGLAGVDQQRADLLAAARKHGLVEEHRRRDDRVGGEDRRHAAGPLRVDQRQVAGAHLFQAARNPGGAEAGRARDMTLLENVVAHRVLLVLSVEC